MNLLIVCESCRKKLSVAIDQAKKKVRCPHCQHVFAVPEAESAVEQEVEQTYTFSHSKSARDTQKMPRPKKEAVTFGPFKLMFVVVVTVAVVLLIRYYQEIVDHFTDPQSASWEATVVKEGNCQVEAPGRLKPIGNTSDPALQEFELRFVRFPLTFTLRIQDHPKLAGDDYGEEARLIQQTDQTIRREWSERAVREKWTEPIPQPIVAKVALGEHTGFEYRFFGNVDKLRVFRRYFVAGKKLYLVGVEMKGDSYWSLADRYLQSFRFLEHKPGVRLKTSPGVAPPNVVRLPTLAGRSILRGHAQPISLLAFAKDDAKLVSAAGRDFLMKWDLASGLGRSALATDGLPFVTLDSTPQFLIAPGFGIGPVPEEQMLFPQRLPQEMKFGALPNLEELYLGATSTSKLALSGDSRWLVATLANQICLWDLERKTEQREPIWRQPSQQLGVECVAVSADGKLAATGGVFDGTVCVWNLETRTLVKKFVAHDMPEPKYATREIELPPKLTEIKDTKDVKPTPPKREKKKIQELVPTPQIPGVQCLAFSPDGKWLVSAGGDLKLAFWDVGPQTIALAKGQKLTERVTALAFSASGRWLAVGDANSQVQVVQFQTLQSRTAFRLQDSTGPISALRFSSDEKKLAIAGEICDGAHWIHLFEMARLIVGP